MRKLLPLAILTLCSGCFNESPDDVYLRTVPVTNNPYVVPNHGGGIPGAAPSSGPY